MMGPLLICVSEMSMLYLFWIDTWWRFTNTYFASFYSILEVAVSKCVSFEKMHLHSSPAYFISCQIQYGPLSYLPAIAPLSTEPVPLTLGNQSVLQICMIVISPILGRSPKLIHQIFFDAFMHKINYPWHVTLIFI